MPSSTIVAIDPRSDDDAIAAGDGDGDGHSCTVSFIRVPHDIPLRTRTNDPV